MRKMHQQARDPSVDIYGLHLFRLVAETGSFTRAGRLAGLTQSAITRQIQNVEARLGRRLARANDPAGVSDSGWPVSAGAVSPHPGRPGALGPTLARGICRSAEAGPRRCFAFHRLAYLPGFFTAFQRRFPLSLVQVNHGSSKEMLAALEARELDVAVLCPPARGCRVRSR